MKILVTGAAGFIGMHLCKALLGKNAEVVGIDNLNDYYDIELKKSRLQELRSKKGFEFKKIDLIEKNKLKDLFLNYKFDRVVNLAAQAGVRYSLINPQAYIDSNITGFLNILECCKDNDIKHLIYASSSSVYGANTFIPFSEDHNVDHPVSLYAASKRSNELMAHSYSQMYGLKTTGLRFFSVYGPWGRPDMATFIFTKAIYKGQEISVFNNGDMSRDFTYIDDIIDGVTKIIDDNWNLEDSFDKSKPKPHISESPFRLFNIGHNNPVNLLDFILELERIIGIKAKKKFLPMQPGDVVSTYANIDLLYKTINFKPTTLLKDGLKHFVDWYKAFYKID